MILLSENYTCWKGHWNQLKIPGNESASLASFCSVFSNKGFVFNILCNIKLVNKIIKIGLIIGLTCNGLNERLHLSHLGEWKGCFQTRENAFWYKALYLCVYNFLTDQCTWRQTRSLLYVNERVMEFWPGFTPPCLSFRGNNSPAHLPPLVPSQPERKDCHQWMPQPYSLCWNHISQPCIG